MLCSTHTPYPENLLVSWCTPPVLKPKLFKNVVLMYKKTGKNTKKIICHGTELKIILSKIEKKEYGKILL